jgi:twinkle protein
MEGSGMKSLSEISSLLAVQVESVCYLLLPGGNQKGGLWICGDLYGQEGKSLQVHLDGPHQGKWRDWAESDLKGDLIDLWMQVRGLTPKQAIFEIRQFLGLPQEISMTERKYGSPHTEHSPLTPTGQVVEWFSVERKINPPTVAKFEIKVHTKGSNGSKEGFIVFPCFSPSGEWVNSSYRGLKPDENGKKKVWQDKGCAPSLFGWHALDQEVYRSRTILLSEGQIDAMTWTQWGIPALSIPNGNGTTWLDYEWENLEVFDTIYLSFDMDGKTAESLRKVVSRLGYHRCLIVSLPKKDANDCLKAGHTEEDAKRWIASAKKAILPDFVSLLDLKDRLMDQFFPRATDLKPIQVPLFKSERQDDCFLIRPGEVSLWTGISSHGKTTFLTYLFVELAYQDEKSFICSMEMTPEQISVKMVKSLFRDKPISPMDICEFVDALGEKTCFCDKRGFIEQSCLFSMMEFAYKRYGVTQFLIDSLMRVDGLEEDYPAQGKFLNLLAEFAKKNKVHVHLVAHPRKTAEDAAPSANDIKGSSMLRNNADNILVVSRNTAKEKRMREGEMSEEEAESEWDNQILVDKDREEGKVKLFRYKFITKHQYFIPMKKVFPAKSSARKEPLKNSSRN